MTRTREPADLEPQIGEPGSVDGAPDERSAAPHAEHQMQGETHERGGHGGHGRWMMIACCIPMLLIALTLVATGVVSSGFILIALLCTAMMALMMGGMSHGDDGSPSHRH